MKKDNLKPWNVKAKQNTPKNVSEIADLFSRLSSSAQDAIIDLVKDLLQNQKNE